LGSPAEEKAAFEYLAKHRDKQYSFTDCLSFVTMDAYGIAEAWAVDSDFTHRFTVKPGPAR
jgi:predicted nucleic acid-binding protein